MHMGLFCGSVSIYVKFMRILCLFENIWKSNSEKNAGLTNYFSF